MGDTARVQVAVRIRPVLKTGGSGLQQQERFSLECATKLDDFTLRLQEQKPDEVCRSSTFTFDYVFDQDSTQYEVYEEALVDLVDAALMGCNATVLAYGQTGSGKTHTVLGEVKDNPLDQELLTSNTGMFMRALRDLLEYREKLSRMTNVVIGLSCIEIYNETVRDLLSATPMEPVKVVMDDEGVYLPNLCQEEIMTLRSVYQIFKIANARRTTRTTEANEASSRSHCLFSIDILQQERHPDLPPPSLDIVNVIPGKEEKKLRSQPSARNLVSSPSLLASQSSAIHQSGEREFYGQVLRRPGEPPIYISKIVFADLAGSEKLKHSQAEGAGRKEAVNINSSLTALGNVVHALFEGSKHVPYRDSKLTRILRPAFNSANARVFLIAALSPTQLTFDESVSTCHFANKVKAMRVVTTTADSHSLHFDYLETLKVSDALACDLRIVNAFQNARTVIRRAAPHLIKAPYQLYQGPSPPSARHAQRIGPLRDLNLIDFAEKDKVYVQKLVVTLEEQEKEELERLREQIRDDLVDEHRLTMQSVTKEIEEISHDNVALRKGVDDATTFIATQSRQEEEELTRLSADVAEMRIRAKELQQKALVVHREGDIVAAELKKEKEKPLPASELDQVHATEDEQYAHLTAYHLSVERFCKVLLSMRFEQFTLYAFRRYTSELCDVALSNAMRLMDVLPSFRQDRKASL